MSKRKRRPVDSGPPLAAYPGSIPGDPYAADAVKVRPNTRPIETVEVDMRSKPTPTNPFPGDDVYREAS